MGLPANFSLIRSGKELIIKFIRGPGLRQQWILGQGRIFKLRQQFASEEQGEITEESRQRWRWKS